MSFISKTIAWMAKEIKAIGQGLGVAANILKVDVAPIVVGITGGINTALESGILTSVAGVIETFVPSLGHLPEQLIVDLKVWTPKIIASALAIEGIPDNPTQEQVLAFEKRIMDAFGIVSDKSKFYTTFAADLYGIILKYSEDPTPKTFASRVIMIEQIFEKYKADVIDQKAAA